VIALVLIAFRSWRLSLLSLAPTAIGIVWAAGVLALAGIALDLFALFAVVTLVGIGVDYGVHVVHRYRERGDPRQAVEELAPVIRGCTTCATRWPRRRVRSRSAWTRATSPPG
jgi:predicted RND superfamily exporter protein